MQLDITSRCQSISSLVSHDIQNSRQVSLAYLTRPITGLLCNFLSTVFLKIVERDGLSLKAVHLKIFDTEVGEVEVEVGSALMLENRKGCDEPMYIQYQIPVKDISIIFRPRDIICNRQR
jgi:hypothetical protein